MASTINDPTGDELLALADLVKNAVEEIVKTTRSQSQPFPSPHEPFSPQSEAIRMSPDIQKHSVVLVAAAAQLIASIRPPPVTLVVQGVQFYVPACIGVALEHHVAEILRAAGPQGLHVNDIAAVTDMDPHKLARILRLLATNFIFREVAPDVFAHSRISSLLDTGKDVKDILANPEAKHDGSSGMAALIEHFTDEGLRSAAYLSEALRHPKFGRSGEPNETALNLAYNTNERAFSFLERPENAYRIRRFAVATEGAQSMVPAAALLKGFDWEALPKDSVIVDIGGNTGAQSLAISKAYDHLRFVVQDLPAVVEAGPKYWEKHLPDAVKSGRIEFQAHDFFTPQPVKEPAVFLLRMILHDWSDEYCLKILRHLRAAAGSDTHLIVVDNVIAYACEQPDSSKSIPGAALPKPPAPLLPNYGESSVMSYLADMQMMTLLNGSERTAVQFKKLFEASGWSLLRVVTDNSFKTFDVKVIAVPARESSTART